MGGIEEWGYWKKHQVIKHRGGTLKSDIHLVWQILPSQKI